MDNGLPSPQRDSQTGFPVERTTLMQGRRKAGVACGHAHSPAGRARSGQGRAGLRSLPCAPEQRRRLRSTASGTTRRGSILGAPHPPGAGAGLRASSRDSAALPLRARAGGLPRPHSARLRQRGGAPRRPAPSSRGRASGCWRGSLRTALSPQLCAPRPLGWGGCGGGGVGGHRAVPGRGRGSGVPSPLPSPPLPVSKAAQCDRVKASPGSLGGGAEGGVRVSELILRDVQTGLGLELGPRPGARSELGKGGECPRRSGNIVRTRV